VKKSARDQERRRRKKGPLPFTLLKWALGLVLVAGIGYLISQADGIRFNEQAIGVVNFSDLSPKGKKAALKAANDARCSCGCGLGLAECVSTDKTCPIRDGNIEKIRGMVRDAGSL